MREGWSMRNRMHRWPFVGPLWMRAHAACANACTTPERPWRYAFGQWACEHVFDER